MKSFYEMITTEEGKHELNQIILATPKLKRKNHELTDLEQHVRDSVDAIEKFGSFDDVKEYIDKSKIDINFELESLGDKVINYDFLDKLVDMACNRLRYEAYKILCEREKEDDNK